MDDKWNIEKRNETFWTENTIEEDKWWKHQIKPDKWCDISWDDKKLILGCELGDCEWIIHLTKVTAYKSLFGLVRSLYMSKNYESELVSLSGKKWYIPD